MELNDQYKARSLLIILGCGGKFSLGCGFYRISWISCLSVTMNGALFQLCLSLEVTDQIKAKIDESLETAKTS